MELAALEPLIECYRRQSETLGKQVRLEQALLEVIREQWPLGARLPPHRKLCEALGVARNTLALAIKSLIEEGYLHTGQGQGTWTRRPHAAKARSGSLEAATAPLPLSHRARRVLGGQGASLIQSGAFVPGIPDIARFPMRKWRQLYASVTVPHNALLLSYSSGGYGPLKREIRDFLRRWRNIDCDTQQIIITEGTHHGIELCALALADAGQRVVMESPCYWGARNVFLAAGLETRQVAWRPLGDTTGSAGHDLAALGEGTVQIAYFTGSHHYPLSVPTSRRDKQRLCEACQPAYILEDDYEFSGDDHGELLFDPDSGNRLLVGSFSKLMFPGLRLGYLVVPRALAGPMNRLRSEVFREGRMLDQAVLAQFIADGDLDAWYQRIQRDYLGRQQVVHDQLSQVKGIISVSPPSRGISLCVQFAPEIDDQRVAQLMVKEHLIVRPLSMVCSGEDSRRGLVLGVGMLAGESLVSEVARLRRTLESILSMRDIRRHN
ncbi:MULTISPECIES: PLP-dependent aminotransferase family protein [unclassified Cobetia]|uniref:aminotransferase-like domain-containing protein n=1 Tax=unclassified Cobetia TaxID=2609414 RepID=UPI002096CF0E|nr:MULTISPECIES: PLP-dependent aminotransferase family protein [unclassified Cobetia]MCO7233232.1 PLP-dependent aminotransferase family protein [Cobetia sp. Dlab-2-AX]MCO7236506.1 PLP-dependent aminotransferase family protein [Cobetia sp. Dlab-2-U]